MDENNNLVLFVGIRNNIIVCEYKVSMQETEENSILNIDNYRLVYNNKGHNLPLNSKIVYVNDKLIRIILYEPNVKIDRITFGYCDMKKIHLIKSLDGVVQDICINYLINKNIKQITLEDSKAEIVDYNIVNISYNGLNKYHNVNKQDYYVKISNKIYYPNEVILYSDRNLLLTFTDNIFKEYIDIPKVGVGLYAKTDDIFGLPIKSGEEVELLNNISSKIKSFIYTGKDIQKSYFELIFTKELAIFDKNDFTIDSNNVVFDFNFEELESSNLKVKLSIDNRYINDEYLKNMNIYTSKPIEQVGTYDKEGRKVYIRNPVYLVKVDTVIVQPIKGALDNPFNGGVLSYNYILLVSNEYSYRVYGLSNVLTTIEGSVTIEGNLGMGEKVKLQGLEIKGKLKINIQMGDYDIGDCIINEIEI